MPTHSTYTPFFGDLPNHPQTWRLAERLVELGMPRRWAPLAYAFIPPLNCWCLAHAEDGDVSHLPAARIAEICGWPVRAKAKEFVAALVDAGFLEETLDESLRAGLVVHNFRAYNRKLLHDRERKRKAAGVPGGAVECSREDSVECSKESARSVPGNAPEKTLERSRPNKSKSKVFNNNAKGSLKHSTTNPRAREDGTATTAASPPRDKKQTTSTATTTTTTTDPAWFRWNVFAEALRRAGWGDANARRMVKWAREKILAAPANFDLHGQLLYWLAAAHYVTAIGSKKKLTDPVSYWLAAITEYGITPTETEYMMAKRGWEHLERELSGNPAPPAWLAELLENIVKPVERV